MAKSSNCLDVKDIKYIRDHHETQTPSEIAKKLRKPYSNVYNYMVRYGIKMLCNRVSKKGEKKKKDKKPPNKGYFDSASNENWII